MSHVQIGYVLVGMIIFYLHVLIASIDSLLLIQLCLTLFEICYMYILYIGGTAAAAPPPSGLATLPSVGAVP